MRSIPLFSAESSTREGEEEDPKGKVEGSAILTISEKGRTGEQENKRKAKPKENGTEDKCWGRTIHNRTSEGPTKT